MKSGSQTWVTRKDTQVEAVDEDCEAATCLVWSRNSIMAEKLGRSEPAREEREQGSGDTEGPWGELWRLF